MDMLTKLSIFELYNSEKKLNERLVKVVKQSYQFSLDNLTKMYLIAVHDYNESKELQDEFFNYLDSDIDIIKSILMLSVYNSFLSTIMSTYFYERYIRGDIDLEKIKLILFGIVNQGLAIKIIFKKIVEYECNNQEKLLTIMNNVKTITPTYALYDTMINLFIMCIDYENWSKFSEFTDKNHISYNLNLIYTNLIYAKFGTDILKKILSFYNKYGYSYSYILTTYLKAYERKYVGLVEALIDMGEINIMIFYRYNSDLRIKEYIDEMILNQV